MVELKAEKQRADQREGVKPAKPDQTAKGPEEEAKEAATGFAGWLSRNKPIAALAVVALVAVCVQALGVVDVKLAVTELLSPITTAVWKVQYCAHTQCAIKHSTDYFALALPSHGVPGCSLVWL